MKTLRRLLPAALSALVSAGCSAASFVTPSSYTVATAAPEATVLSLFHGQAEANINPDGTACTFVVRHTSRTAIVWPTGYSGRGTPVTVYDTAGTSVFVAGKPISLSGGQVLSNKTRKVNGCNGFSQSVAYVPAQPPVTASPAGTQRFSTLQIGKMQEIVNGRPDLFGGLWADPAAQIVTICIAPGADPPSVATAKQALFSVIAYPGGIMSPEDAWQVGFITAGPSISALTVVRERVLSAQPWRRDVGQNLNGWGIDPQRHAVMVGVREITPLLSADALSAFRKLVILETQDPGIPQ